MGKRRGYHPDADARQKADRPDQAEIQFGERSLSAHHVNRPVLHLRCRLSQLCHCHCIPSFIHFLALPFSDSAYTRKSPALSVRLCRGRMFTRFHLACSVPLSRRRNHSFDCNASQRTILRPLRAGFQMFPAKALSALGASLCCLPHPTLLVNVLFYKLYPYSMSDYPKSKAKNLPVHISPTFFLQIIRPLVYITNFFSPMHSSHSTFYISYRCRRDRDRLDKLSCPCGR